MEACYVNTAHPDFLNGHQAIAIVNDQISGKQQQQQQTPNNSSDHSKTNKQLAALQTNNPSLPNTDADSGSFFGSFFSGPKKTKKTNSMMEPVCIDFDCYFFKRKVVLFYVLRLYTFACF